MKSIWRKRKRIFWQKLVSSRERRCTKYDGAAPRRDEEMIDSSSNARCRCKCKENTWRRWLQGFRTRRSINKNRIIVIIVVNENKNKNNNAVPPRRDTGKAPHEQQQEEQNALTSPPRRITLQPSPLKASNQRPEASPGMRALGLSPSP